MNIDTSNITNEKKLTIEVVTLRDYFAAKAMQGMLSNPNIRMDAVFIAGYSYQYADAMLKAREE